MNSQYNRAPGRRAVLAAAVAAGLLVSLTPAVAQAAPARRTVCQAVALPVPAGTESEVNGGDPTGRYLVGRVEYPDRSAVALWQDGILNEIDVSSLPNLRVDLHDVNRHGVVVGERTINNTSFHSDAFSYRDGVFTMLPPLNPGEPTRALGINSRGDVVGTSGDGWRPVVWPARQPGTVRALPLPAGATRALVTGIDEDGSVVGHLAPYPPGTPYLWPTRGRPRALPVPAGSMGGSADAIQGGMVAGNVWNPATNSTAPALWNLRTGGFTLYTDVQSGAISVNSKGTIGGGGVIVHANGRVSPVGSEALVYTVADNGTAAGTTKMFHGQAVTWIGC